jgi:hypothetical protein
MEKVKNMKKCYKSADILLPDFDKVSPEKWAVVACDQYTSEPEYWEKAEKIVGDAPSTLKMILPEVYLSEKDKRIPEINKTMKEYLTDVLKEIPDAMVYVEREQSDGSVREGLLLAVDLECYDFKKGASSLIRATEATVMERIPPRVAIRRDATVELPHVMLLIDDPKKTVIEPLANMTGGKVIYDTDLMLRGGHIKGTLIDDKAKLEVEKKLDALICREGMEERYKDASLAPVLFAVGDGNHSLATAKTIYEELKAKIGEEAAANSPARYALAEVVNIHSEALRFEPIYRVMFGVDRRDVVEKLKDYANGLQGNAEPQMIKYIFDGKSGEIEVKAPVRQLTVGTLQDFIDDYMAGKDGVEVDYIHGEASVEALSRKNGAIGFMFSGMGKDQLFKTVIFDGALPRKTFSMGHAEDKRYYLECRKIVD